MSYITKVSTYFLKIPLDRTIQDSLFTVSTIGFPAIKVSTNEGVDGWGFNWNTAGGAEFAKEMLDRYMSRVLMNQDPLRRKKILTELFEVENFGWDFRLGRNGLGVMAASMVDMALWDILCKKAGLPLWKILGGFNDRVEAYNTHGGWLSWSLEELVTNSKNLVAEGYKAIKIKIGSKNPQDDYLRLKSVRDAVGNGIKVMIDANGKWDLETALRWARRLDDFNPFWLEEPLDPLDIRGHSTLRNRISTPIAVGESIHNKFTFRDYIVQGAADILQVDATKVSGIDEWIEIANFADTFNVNVYPHTNIQQPLHVQLVGAVRNASVVEHVPWLLDVWETPTEPKNGYFELTQIPGAGTEVRVSAIEKYAQA
jgi:L-alanine-DL-glutamate epimerase-like enolase superfamily enzyme